MNHIRYDKQVQQIKSLEDKRSEEFDMTMKVIISIAFCVFWIYLMQSIADFVITIMDI